MFWGAIPYGICGYLMFAGPDLGPTGKIVYAYVTYALMLMSYTVINVPYSSLLGVISPSSRTRTVARKFPLRRRVRRGVAHLAVRQAAGEIPGRRRRNSGFQ